MARTLARQFLGWQLGIVALLLLAVAALAVVQEDAAFRETQGRRMLSLAEDVAATATLRSSLERRSFGPLPPLATSARNISGADDIMIVDAGGVVRTSADPAQVGAAGPTPAGRSSVSSPDGRTVVAQVPVLGDAGQLVGMVEARAEAPSVLAVILAAPGATVLLLGVALAVGVLGSLLLARRVRRQTLGLEPTEIVELVHRREAMLLGVKEGVIGLDEDGRVTLLNATAQELGLARGADVLASGLDERLRDVLTGAATGADQVVLHGGKVLVLNRMPVVVDGAPAGAVVTLRDRTELAALEHRLDASRHVTDTLRAQHHEFANRMHTIAGLAELGEYEEVRRFVAGVVAGGDQWRREVTSRVGDAAAAALLVAKASLATERGVELRFAGDARLPPIAHDPTLSADLVTVLGNLVDNAIDAASPGWVEIDLCASPAEVRVVVRDSGPGVASGLVTEVFRHGFSTKVAERDTGGRGLGLALARQACQRRGGDITLHNAPGAVFTAVLPLAV